MNKKLTVDIVTKTGRTYAFNNVAKINYNFNHGTMINIAVDQKDGTRKFSTFSKSNIEVIGVCTNDDGNDQYAYEENGNDNYLSNDNDYSEPVDYDTVYDEVPDRGEEV